MVAAPLLDSSSGCAWTVSSRSEVSDMGGSQSFRAGVASAIVAEATDDLSVDRCQRRGGTRRSREARTRAQPGSGLRLAAVEAGHRCPHRWIDVDVHGRDQRRYAAGNSTTPLTVRRKTATSG